MMINHALRQGWVAFREVFRNWNVCTGEDLTNCLGTHGHPRSSPGSYLAARTQELILSAACGSDARVALLEGVFVAIVIDMGRAIANPFVSSSSVESAHDNQKRTSSCAHRDHSRQLGPIGPGGPRRDVLDASPMLKNCPHFLRGRLRFCFFALREKLRAKSGE